MEICFVSSFSGEWNESPLNECKINASENATRWPQGLTASVKHQYLSYIQDIKTRKNVIIFLSLNCHSIFQLFLLFFDMKSYLFFFTVET